ncbi:MAG: hypothetical protein LBO05_09085 [Deltaproteobacteria bacterium]|jgi:hypothetical protein|nr:hypothetical protein [Deltaproteobacteria bacterium]
MIRALAVSTLAALLSFLAVSCGPPKAPLTPAQSVAPCEGRDRADLMGLQSVYRAAATNSCKVAVLPFDMGAWIEAPLNSRKAKGLRTVVLGCSNLTPDAADCAYGGPLGHSVTLQLNYNAAVYPDTARVQRAVLAVQVLDNPGFFAQTAQLRGRLLTGDVLQSLGDPVLAPSATPGWILYDVTEFAARAINERRTSISFELSLPCGRSEAELTTVAMLQAEPRLIVEFK